MLLALAIGSGTLAYTGMAAWWVIVPPTAMVLGYLTLLREASKADAERREQARVRAPAAVAAAGRAAPRARRLTLRSSTSPPRSPRPATSSTTSTPTPRSARWAT